ncbi:hypothetical protein B0A63_07845 [Flavobacterium johnsoniae UW101]|nr:hypothetical protein B0A63_07845 [Flavobacterium johnsoniae UW101]
MSSHWDFLFFKIKFLKRTPKIKHCLSSSPDGSGNPFAFSFKKQKIAAYSRNQFLLKMQNLSLLINILFNYE